jgi:hypothetical protein
VFRYTSWHFYTFSGTNLLTRCHSASSLFSTIFVFQKSYTGNILGIERNQSQTSRYSQELPEHQRRDGEEPLVGHTTRGCGLGLARAPYGEPHQGHLWRCPFAYKDPPMGKPEIPDHFSRIYRDPPLPSTQRLGGSISSSRHPAGEGNHHRRSSSSSGLPPAWRVSKLPWTMGP